MQLHPHDRAYLLFIGLLFAFGATLYGLHVVKTIWLPAPAECRCGADTGAAP